MKNINYVINGVLAVAVVILFILQFTGKKESTVQRMVAQSGESVGAVPIAFVNVDSLLQNYNYAKDMYELQLKKQENARANITQEARKLESEMVEFRRKMENNAFLTNQRAEDEQNRLMKKQQELQELDARTANELMAEQQKMSEQLRDSIVSQLKIYNKDKGYHLIFSDTGGDNILLAEDAYDITSELLEVLNKRYATSK